MNSIRYADDTTLLANSQAELQDLIERVSIASEDVGLFFNVKKTKIIACVNLNSPKSSNLSTILHTPYGVRVNDDEPVMLTVGGQDFNFFGSYITNKGGTGSAKE